MEQLQKAIKRLKRSIAIAYSIGVNSGYSAAVLHKIIDALDVVANPDRFNVETAVDDVMLSATIVQMSIYNILSRRLNKESPRDLAGNCLIKDKKYEEAYNQYIKANEEISQGTDTQRMFQEEQ